MADMTLGPGSVVARRFRLEDLLDEHSGARFWRATDTALARNVAVHVLPSDDPRAAATLEAARRSATVTDPHLLRVLDAIQEHDHLHVVHEWGSGLSLDRMLEDGPLDPRKAAWLVREVAEALCVAHRHGVAHGRLVPENVMVTDLGAVKLVGFVVDGVLQGTSAAGPGDPGGDIRNLGALLYAALTGRWPGSPASQVPAAPLDGDRALRPRQVRAGVPRPLDALCEELLGLSSSTPFTAQLVQRRLGEFLGDPVQGTQLDDQLDDQLDGATALLDRRALQEALGQDPEATQAMRFGAGLAASPDGPGDPENDPQDPDLQATGELPRHDSETTATRQVRPLPRPAPSGSSGSSGPAGPDGSDSGGSAPTLAPPPLTPAAAAGPLFAEPPRRVVPDTWGPDADTGSGPIVVLPHEAPGNAWIRRAAALGALLLVVLAAIVAYRLAADRPPGDDGDAPQDQQSQPPQSIAVASAADFDPDGEGSGENPDQVPLAVDGDPGTAWQTMTYFDGPVLAPYRSGVGLLLDLGEEIDVREVDATLVGEGYDVALLAVPQESGAPTTTEGLTEVAAVQGTGGEVTLSAEEPVPTRYLVLWLTALPAVDGGFRGAVAEVDVRS